MKRYFLPAVLIIFAACTNGDENGNDIDNSIKTFPTPVIGYTIIAEYPHDTSAYTQGLEFHNGKLIEGTGDFETSSLRITDHKTGKVEKKHMMGTDSVFGEGITVLNNKIYQLTWESNIVYVYEANNIDKPIKTFKWPYDGWGLTNNGADLIISDGSANLYFVDPENFRLKKTISVTEKGSPVFYLNELEMIDGFIFANIYQTEQIIKIDPESGHVIGKMDFKGIQQKYFADKITSRTDYFNGIAYDSSKKTLFVTGKRWPKMFELRLN